MNPQESKMESPWSAALNACIIGICSLITSMRDEAVAPHFFIATLLAGNYALFNNTKKSRIISHLFALVLVSMPIIYNNDKIIQYIIGVAIYVVYAVICTLCDVLTCDER